MAGECAERHVVRRRGRSGNRLDHVPGQGRSGHVPPQRRDVALLDYEVARDVALLDYEAASSRSSSRRLRKRAPTMPAAARSANGAATIAT
jgi:hypothetical protein